LRAIPAFRSEMAPGRCLRPPLCLRRGSACGPKGEGQLHGTRPRSHYGHQSTFALVNASSPCAPRIRLSASSTADIEDAIHHARTNLGGPRNWQSARLARDHRPNRGNLIYDSSCSQEPSRANQRR
jgi:hypothetical protein